jgi:hypothetical protein
MTAQKHATKNGRKLFFAAGAVRKYLQACRTGYDLRAFHSERIAAHPQFANGTAITKERAAIELKVSKRGVDYYLNRAILKRVPSSSRTTLISRKSVDRLARARLAKTEREYKVARERLERAEKKRKRLARMNDAPGHVIWERVFATSQFSNGSPSRIA